MADRPLDVTDAPTSDHMSARNQGTAQTSCGKRRRRWTAEQKRQIVAESMAAGASVATVARTHGVSSGQVYAWRQQLLLGGTLVAAAGTASSLMGVTVTPAVPRLAAAIPAPSEPNIPAAQVAPTPPVQPDADIMQTSGESVPVNEDLGAEAAPTTDRGSVLNSPIAVRANRAWADKSGEVAPNSGRWRALRRLCQWNVTRRSPVPRKQLLDLVLFDAARDQTFQYVGEPGEWLDTIQLCGRNQRHYDGPPDCPAVAASEKRVLSCQSYRPHAAFDDVGIDLDAAIVEKQYQSGPVPQRVAHGGRQRRSTGQSGQLLLQPGVQRLDDRTAALLTDGVAMLGSMTADLRLDLVELADSRERFGGERRLGGDVEFVERPSCVGPTCVRKVLGRRMDVV